MYAGYSAYPEEVATPGSWFRNLLLVSFIIEIWEYREYLKQSVLRDLRTKYKRSALGYVWTMLHPLAMMSVLAVVFSHIVRMDIKDYAIFLFCGILPWNYFSSSSMMSLHSIRANAKLFTQVPVPKYIFVVSLVSSNLVNLFLATVPLLILTLAMGRSIPLTAFALPIVLLPLCCVVIGVSLVLATANVFFDDTLHLAEVGLQALYFLCPIFYQREMLPANLTQYLSLSPLFQQIEFFRGIFYTGVLPDLQAWLINMAASLLVLLFGLFVFRRNDDKFLYFV